ncbi:hypothetical protein D3C87_1225770 [compost metagenome]
MAHGRQKRSLRPVGVVGDVLGFLQLSKQLLTLTDLPTLPGDPRHGEQEQGASNRERLENALSMAQPITLFHHQVIAPRQYQRVDFFRRNTQQCLVQNRMQLGGIATGRQGTARGIGAHGAGDLEAITVLPGNQVTGADQ